MHFLKKRYSIFILLFTALLNCSAAYADTVSQINMLRDTGTTAHALEYIQMSIFWFFVATSFGVFSAMIYLLIQHRKSLTPEIHFHKCMLLEICWTIIPFIILLLLLLPTAKVLLIM